MRDKTLFGIGAIILILVSFIWLLTAPTALKATVFLSTLIISLGAYTLIYGSLSKFSIKALSAEATFIKETAENIKDDSKEISNIKEAINDSVNEIEIIKADLKKSLKNSQMLEHKLLVKSQSIRSLERKVFDPDGVGKPWR